MLSLSWGYLFSWRVGFEKGMGKMDGLFSDDLDGGGKAKKNSDYKLQTRVYVGHGEVLSKF